MRGAPCSLPAAELQTDSCCLDIPDSRFAFFSFNIKVASQCIFSPKQIIVSFCSSHYTHVPPPLISRQPNFQSLFFFLLITFYNGRQRGNV